MSARLIQVENGHEAASLALDSKVLLIGRDPDADLCINDRYDRVSRRHAEIRRIGKQHVLVDLRSHNGTWVNGVQLQGETFLQPDDKIALAGQVHLYYKDSASESSFSLRVALLLAVLTAAVIGGGWYLTGMSPKEVASRLIDRSRASFNASSNDSPKIPVEITDVARQAVAAHESGNSKEAVRLLHRAVYGLYRGGYLDDVPREGTQTAALTRLGHTLDIDLIDLLEQALRQRVVIAPQVDVECRLDAVPASQFDACLRRWVRFVFVELRQNPDAVPDWFYADVARTIRAKHTYIRRSLERGRPYIPTIKRELSKQKMPELIHYLAMVESGYREDVASSAGATGMWQFMKATARNMGLVVKGDVDERKDWRKSTRAAAAHLRDLARRYLGDLPLVLAGYNRGEGHMAKSMAKIEDVWNLTYWKMKEDDLLPNETREYVPRFVAFATSGEGGLPSLQTLKRAGY